MVSAWLSGARTACEAPAIMREFLGPWHSLCNLERRELLATLGWGWGVETMSAHLLIVEDDSEMRNLLRKVLEKEGYDVSVAADGHEAAGCLSRRPFDLVVTDMLMPDNGGLELLRDIRKTQPGLPVIIITAFGDWRSYSRALELGAAAFISKPLKMAELIAAIQTALAGSGAGEAVLGA